MCCKDCTASVRTILSPLQSPLRLQAQASLPSGVLAPFLCQLWQLLPFHWLQLPLPAPLAIPIREAQLLIGLLFGVPYFYGEFFPPPRGFFSRLSSRRLVCQGSKAASKQVSQPASKQAKKGASEQASKQASQPASKQASKGASEQTKKASKQASQPASEPASKQARGPASKASKKARKQASEQASKRASERASKRASEQTNQPSKQASKGASKGASEQTIFLRGISVRTEVVTSYWLYTPISIDTYALYLLALMERKKGILQVSKLLVSGMKV